MTTHLHITSWILLLALFGLAIFFNRLGREKAGKIVQMIMRLDYLLILYSGGSLLGAYFQYANGAEIGESIVKAIAGIWVIGIVEVLTTRSHKRKKAGTALWVQFFIAFIITIVLGFGRLGYGIYLG
ncbi:hypothetical protein N781_15095 [Pontibacillus halophilus JSM 076056 = DSM 19796]|uniref:UPF0344 protein N781_15095 n=1 Tax=Pontibacillus halophilus JSM 076056 = DSM 19796 TaxID=1385510 RepID=A0A0A5GKY6_9BACI|nr:YisL family protein [Pontibacillus halophilus]KGX92644.1 hypothetical protein N781_15095 [Pontibacillus halophilus JSM 076056 = DSM 19796]